MIIGIILLAVLFFAVFNYISVCCSSTEIYVFILISDIICIILMKHYFTFNIGTFFIGFFIGIFITILKNIWGS